MHIKQAFKPPFSLQNHCQAYAISPSSYENSWKNAQINLLIPKANSSFLDSNPFKLFDIICKLL